MKRAGILSLAALALVLVAAAPSAADDNCLRQGEFAVALAVQIRLDVATEAEAVGSLTDIGITPVNGWKPPAFLDEKAFGEIDRAVVVAFAEGRLVRGGPSAARAVLAAERVSDICRQRYFSVGATTASPSLKKGTAVSQSETARSHIVAGSGNAAAPGPEEENPRPGIEDPEPGKKPHPFSPFEPWDGPTRPGPGSK